MRSAWEVLDAFFGGVEGGAVPSQLGALRHIPWITPIIRASLREAAASPRGRQPSLTCAHVKRMALKARNRARHKAAVRRASR